MENIIEGNKIIAEFMGDPFILMKNGLVVCDDEWERLEFKTYDEADSYRKKNNKSNYEISYPYEYHSSWDWLMPVVEKIERERDMYFRIERDWVYICRFNDYSGVVVKTNTFTHKGGKIYGVWLAVVEFIEYYNKEQKAQVSDTTKRL
jgi:hypothetical protein